MIPDITNTEWEKLVNGEMIPKLNSLTMQLKLNAIKLDLKLNRMDVKSAIADFHTFCLQHEQMIQKDIDAIFHL